MPAPAVRGDKEGMDENIQTLLFAAMQSEAFACARYAQFAEAARAGGDERLAALFDGLAHVDLTEHFAKLAELARLVGSDADNLAAAVQEENTVAETTYREYARRARAAGEPDVERLFDELAAEAGSHARALEDELEAIEAPT